MKYTDEMLSAYLDKELSAGEITEIDAALAGDSALRARLDELRRVDEIVRDSYASIASEPLPERVVSLLTSKESGEPEASENVVPFAGSKRVKLPDGWRSAIAASLALIAGLLVGVYGINRTEPAASAAVAQWSGELPADGALAVALSTVPSGQAVQLDRAAGYFVSMLTIETANDEFCREFSFSDGAGGVHGVACGSNGEWRMEIAQRIERGWTISSGDNYRAALSRSPAAIDDFVSGAMIGDVLDVSREHALIDRGWRQE